MENRDFPHARITGALIGGFYDVYNQLGRGFLESVYERSLYFVLKEAGLSIQQQVPVRVTFRNHDVG